MTEAHHDGSRDFTLTAFRYVSGELTSGEREGFESLLAANLDAQQALADVVLICESVADATDNIALPATPDRVASQRRSRHAGGFAVGAAVAAVACAAICLWTQFPDHQFSVDGVSPSVAPWSRMESADSIVSVWSELGTDDGGIPTDEREDEDAAAEEFPDWLMSAVSPPSDETESIPQPDDFEFDDELDEDES